MEILSATITRRLSGVEFKLKSSVLEELFSLIATGQANDAPTTRAAPDSPRGARPTTPWGSKHYQFDMAENGIPAQMPGFSAGRFDMWGSRELILPRNPPLNLSMLTAVGLGSTDGVTLLIPTVITPTNLRTFADRMDAAVRQIYIDFLKESSIEIRITTEVIIREKNG